MRGMGFGLHLYGINLRGQILKVSHLSFSGIISNADGQYYGIEVFSFFFYRFLKFLSCIIRIFFPYPYLLFYLCFL